MTRLAGLLVFVLALALRLAYVHEHHTELGLDVSQLQQTDNHVFASWARVLAAGDWLGEQQPHAFHHWTREIAPESRWDEWYGGRAVFHQAPLYPYVVAAVYRLFGNSHEIVGYAQAVLGALCCWLTWLLGCRSINARAGLAAGLLLAFMGPYVFYDAFILRDGFMALLVVILALALQQAVEHDRLPRWLLAGAALGLFSLGKETGPALLALTLLAVGLWKRCEPRRLALTAAALVCGFGLVLAPAVARNLAVGAPAFKFSTRGPEVFVTGNARGQTGVSWEPPTELLREILMETNFSLSRSMVATLATHRADPWGYVELLGNKTAAFLNGYEVPNNVNFYLHRAHLATLRVGFVSMTFMAPAALLGMLLGLRNRRRLASSYLLLLSLSASVIALYILARFRLQVLPLVALFAGLSVDWTLTAVTRRQWGRLTAAAVPFALLVGWCWPDSALTSAFNERTKNATVMLSLAKIGNFDQAMRYRDMMQRQALSDDGGELDASTTDKLATIDAAFEAFAEATTLAEDDPQRALVLGRGYLALVPITKRADLADFTELGRASFRRALELDPAVRDANHGLGLLELEIARHWQFGRTEIDYGPALAQFMAELERHPDHALAHRDAGLIRFGWGHAPEALRHFLLARQHGAADAQVLAGIAAISVDTMQMNARPVRVANEPVPVFDNDRALEAIEEALALAPDDPNVRDVASKVLYVHGRYDEAVALIESLRADQPWRDGELVARAEAFRKVQRNKAAAAPDAGAGADADADASDTSGEAAGSDVEPAEEAGPSDTSEDSDPP